MARTSTASLKILRFKRSRWKALDRAASGRDGVLAVGGMFYVKASPFTMSLGQRPARFWSLKRALPGREVIASRTAARQYTHGPYRQICGLPDEVPIPHLSVGCVLPSDNLGTSAIEQVLFLSFALRVLGEAEGQDVVS